MPTKERIILDIFFKHRDTQFVWGKSDCLCYAAACAKGITGTDPMTHLRNRYRSSTGAKRVMVKHGWKTLGDVAASMYEEIGVQELQTGDWAFILNEDGSETLGVVCASVISAMLPQGIGQVSTRKAVRGFRVK